MQIEKTEFKGWEAYHLTFGDTEMIVVTGIGPRIISLRVSGGENILWVDETRITRGDWHIYGGHRLWVSPENEGCYAPDNDPCAITETDEAFTVTAPVVSMTGLQKRLTISFRDDRFAIEHGVLNATDMLATGAIWALTCVAPKGVVTLPWGTGGEWDTKKIVFWNKWGGTHASDVESSQWGAGKDLFQIRPTGEEGKMGTNSPEAWIALCRDDATFIKQFQYDSNTVYGDDNCCAEVYTCEHFIEMESLGPVTTLSPGEEMTHREIWTVTGKAVSPDDAGSLRALLAKENT